jgi:penicillin-binding protein 1A
VAIDPRNGAVKAMVGGNNYRKSQFNLAVQGVRQPGSSFKPFVLATALREGISPGDAFRVEAADDQPRRQVLGGQQLRQFLPRLDRSRARDDRVDNAVYAQLTQLVGLEARRRDRQAHGDRSKLDGYFAIGLGAER